MLVAKKLKGKKRRAAHGGTDIKERNALEIETVTLMEKRCRRLLFRCDCDRSL